MEEFQTTQRPLEARAPSSCVHCALWKATCRLGRWVTQRSIPASLLSFKNGSFLVMEAMSVAITMASQP